MAERVSLKRWPKKPDGSSGSSEPKRKPRAPKAEPEPDNTSEAAED